ncbi:DNA-binding response regulator/sensor histidine kinase [Bacteroides pyogenes JCM 10003]|nr:DNA-binding response regulator/sensor histidine kinase [Bacteroides pyogenes JCM 10003]
MIPTPAILLTTGTLKQLARLGQWLLAFAFLLITGCTPQTGKKAEPKERYLTLEKQLKEVKHEESLKELLKHYSSANDRVALMLCYKQLGKIQRENARFSDAIASHQEGLTLAYALADTIEIVQALNNLGTNFRRIGALAEASDYHYRALEHAEAYSDKLSPEGRKNRVVSMNGIGNVSLTLILRRRREILPPLTRRGNRTEQPHRTGYQPCQSGSHIRREGTIRLGRGVLPSIDGTEPHRRF